MALESVIASANYLRNSASSVSTLPASVGCWFNMPAAGTTFRNVWQFQDPTIADSYFGLLISNIETVNASFRAIGTSSINTGITATALGAGDWVFVLARGITATSKRYSMYRLNGTNAGLLEHAQATQSRLPVGMTMITVGASEASGAVVATSYLGGRVAEFWYTATDIVGADIQTPDELVRQLAFHGPFSYRPMVKDIIEYRSFRKDTYGGDIGNIYFGAGKGTQVWEPINTPTIAPHVPLPRAVSPKPALRLYKYTPAFEIAYVRMQPDADAIDGTWTNQDDGSELFSAIDESPIDDADYIKSAYTPAGDVCKIRLSDPTETPGEPFIVQYRYRKNGTAQIDLTVRLLEGTTEIAEWVHTDIADTFVTTDQTLSGGEFAAIGDFNNLFIEFTANAP